LPQTELERYLELIAALRDLQKIIVPSILVL
jgi:hypothetical protein